ncbi:putative callose synthase 8 isoform X1 [Malania oleifera]|uniref:putative callose synthase 8 isoform X1 n=1 Tax=Malania oleifera TaxID=397392 RepID=UPI0025ADB9FB|nr:putative callose synthase 8 isoform X1 [Malania oleifera]
MTASEVAKVLSEVLKTFTKAADPQAFANGDNIETESKFFVPYNILPLARGGARFAIMQLPEIKAAVAAVRNIRGLPFVEDFQQQGALVDLFDWLYHCFGFQKGNVANQREHLILLLANTHIRHPHKQTCISKLGDGAVNELMKKFFKNYTNWCKFLGRKSNIRLPHVKLEAQQHKLLYLALYLLIWGEAANVRFMPECLSYIFHQMAYDLHGILTRAIIMTTWANVQPAYGGGPESFLNSVITPLYRVIYEEAENSKNGTADHSTWRNYDDLNEFFWSLNCFQIGWPMRLNHDFFCTRSSNDPINSNSQSSCKAATGQRKIKENVDEENGVDNIVSDMQIIMQSHLIHLDFFDLLKRVWGILSFKATDIAEDACEQKWLGKTNFVEIRSFLHIFRSFDRMWSFLILSLQALIIMACHDLGSPFQVFDEGVFEDVMSIFITSAILKFVQAILDISFTWKARQMMDFSQILKFVLKLVLAAIWTVILPIYYFNSGRKYTCQSAQYGRWIREWCFSSYMVAVMIYLTTNAVEMVLFFIPSVRRYIETSNFWICSILSWWTQPRLYVGRGMQERQISLFKYTFFWLMLLLSKFAFSYNFEIKPLITPTKKIMKIGVERYDWHELFPEVKNNAGAILAVWAPIILVYFMDVQIWYSVYCALFGGIYGILHHLGEIRTLGMLRSRFHSLPSAFNALLIPPASRKDQEKSRKGFSYRRFQKVSKNEKKGLAKFVLVWNQIINSFRSEDLISNRELELMTIPFSSELFSGIVRWPVFLLANKFSTALSIARDFVGRDEKLFRKIKKDTYMYSAVKECYESLKYIFKFLLVGDLEERIVSCIVAEVEESIGKSSFLEDFKMSELSALLAKCGDLVELLVDRNGHRYEVTKILQDIFELITNDMMKNGSRILSLLHTSQSMENGPTLFSGVIEPQLFASINFPLPDTAPLNQQIKRLHLLLTVKDTAMDIPANLEAQRRISFFATSLFMDIPSAPKVRNMLSLSIITPHYMEEVKFSLKELSSSQEGVSIIYYMQKIYPDEWKNFLERIGCGITDRLESERKDEELRYWAAPGEQMPKRADECTGCGNLDDNPEERRNWASFRGQTLSRTVRGMMYYRKAIKLQAFLDMAEDEDILKGYDAVEAGNDALSAQLDALADMKFTYVISCQEFGSQKSSGDPQAQDILDLMIRYPSLRVAYVEEKEENLAVDNPQKVYASILLKAVGSYDQEIYRIKLPGSPNIGEGKPENQNHAIIFTRGEALQTIDMNQDNYLEEALKMRNLLQEFLIHQGQRPPSILGLRENIFTGSVSSLAWFMSYQETSFVTIGQRLLANPLRVRFHYGHPDIFNRIFHITRGGISKASKTINLSEDVFAGFNSTLRRGYVTYHEYLQVGKGRDVGLNQISKFEAKIANGNSEQTLSRDMYRLGRQFDFFRMLSCYFTTIGFYFNSLLSVIGIYVFLYGQLYLVLSGLEKALLLEARMQNIKSLETALASQSFIQLGLLTGLPMVIEIGLEKGFLTALKDFVLMQLQLAAVFFTFSLGTKSHYYGRTILHGGAKYRPTGRKVVVFHASFTENYRLYSRSHFVKGFELLLLLIVYYLFRRSYQSSMAYVLITYSIWFMSLTWLFAPFLFNPSGFNWGKIVDDWKDWNKWIKHQGGIGIPQDKSWQSWWNDEQAHLHHSRISSRLIEVLLSLRFFIYQYGLVYHLDISQENKNFLVYVLSWIVILAVFLLVKVY